MGFDVTSEPLQLSKRGNSTGSVGEVGRRREGCHIGSEDAAFWEDIISRWVILAGFAARRHQRQPTRQHEDKQKGRSAPAGAPSAASHPRPSAEAARLPSTHFHPPAPLLSGSEIAFCKKTAQARPVNVWHSVHPPAGLERFAHADNEGRAYTATPANFGPG